MIRRLLVADRGEAARRVLTTCRAAGIETVAVHSDLDSGAPHVTEADWAVHLPGSAPSATYLRGDLLLAAARRTGADAVHPGWGQLAADAEFATAVTDHGLTWLGPAPKALALLDDQHAVRGRLTQAGLALAPAPGEPVPATSPVRRVDVPVVVDGHRDPLALPERECSIRRRRQPLLVETPSPAVPPQLREPAGRAAVAAASVLDCTGVVTVELLISADGQISVRGLRPWLGPEHAVTECATGCDLVRMQLLIADGSPAPLTAPPTARGHTIAVPVRAEDPAYAWHPTSGRLHRFALSPVAARFRPLPAAGLRLDAATGTGGEIRGGYDSTLATVTGRGPGRQEAAQLLAAALARAQIHGVTSNRDLLVRILRHPVFLAGAADTRFLDEHPEVFAPLLSSVEGVRLSCLAAALAAAADRRAHAPVLPSLAAGWRNVPSGAQTAVYSGPTGTAEIGYRLSRTGELASWWVRSVDPDELDLAGLGQPSSLPEEHPPVALISATAERVVLDVAGVRLSFSVHRVGDTAYLDSPEGSVVLTEVPRYPVPSLADDRPD